MTPTAKTLRALLEEAASNLLVYRSPDLDEVRQRLNEVLEAAGLGTTSNDRIESIAEFREDDSFVIHTAWTARGCSQTSEYRLPASIVDAADPLEAAKSWKHDKEVAEARAALAKAESDFARARERLQALVPADADPGVPDDAPGSWQLLSNDHIARLFNPLDGALISPDEMARRFARRIEAAVMTQVQPDLSLLTTALASPDAETACDICQDHQGQVEALSWLPKGTNLFSEQSVRALLATAITMARPLDAIDGDVLPRIGSRVFIRHGRDADAHACIVTGFYAWEGLGRNKNMHRVFVRMVYDGTDTPQARHLSDCYPTAEAALAKEAPTIAQGALLEWDVAHAIAYTAAAAFRPAYFNGPGFVPHTWVVEAIRTAYMDGQREALGLPLIDRQGALAPEDRLSDAPGKASA